MEEINQVLGTIPDWILILFTIFSFVISIISLNISKKSYKLAEKNDSRLTPNIEVKHLGSYLKIGEEYHTYTIRVQASNLAHASNSIKDMHLKVNYYKAGQENIMIFAEDRNVNRETVAMQIEGGNTKELVGKFKLHNEFITSVKIKSYQVDMIDIYNNKYSIEISVICKE